MKRLLVGLVSKVMGAPSIEEYAEQNLALFFDANDISDPELTCYKIDRDQARPHLYNRVYVGRAKHRGKLVALVILYEEDSGFTTGEAFDPKDAHRHRAVVNAYRAAPSHHQHLYDAFCSKWGPRLANLRNSVEYGK